MDVPVSDREGSSRATLLALGALGLMAVIWGYNWVVMKVALRYFEPASFAAMRIFFGSLMLFGVMLVTRRSLRPKHLFMTFLVGFFQVTGSIGLMVWALKAGAAGKTSILVYTMPVWLLLMSFFILNERLRVLQWVAVAIAFSGLVFVLSPWDLHGTQTSYLLAVLSGICWAASTTTAKVLNRRAKTDVLSMTAWQMFLGSIPLIIVALATTRSAPVWNVSSVAALLFNVVLASGLALLLWYYAVRTLSSGTAGISSLAAPVIAVVATWLQLGERPDRFEAIGMVLIIMSLCMLVGRGLAVQRRGAPALAVVPAKAVERLPDSSQG